MMVGFGIFCQRAESMVSSLTASPQDPNGAKQPSLTLSPPCMYVAMMFWFWKVVSSTPDLTGPTPYQIKVHFCLFSPVFLNVSATIRMLPGECGTSLCVLMGQQWFWFLELSCWGHLSLLFLLKQFPRSDTHWFFLGAACCAHGLSFFILPFMYERVCTWLLLRNVGMQSCPSHAVCKSD